MISGYRSALYDELLAGWRRIEFNAMSRGGMRRECLWLNFPAGLPLHDTSVAGDTFREARADEAEARPLEASTGGDGSGRAADRARSAIRGPADIAVNGEADRPR